MDRTEQAKRERLAAAMDSPMAAYALEQRLTDTALHADNLLIMSIGAVKRLPTQDEVDRLRQIVKTPLIEDAVWLDNLYEALLPDDDFDAEEEQSRQARNQPDRS